MAAARDFPSSRHVQGMPPRPPPEPPQAPGEPRPTTQALYDQHWKYVFRLLPGFGIWGHEAAWEVAQDVWLTVHRRVASYDPDVHQSPCAWLTGIVRRCAANHRRARKRHGEVFSEPLGPRSDTRPAPGLNPEEAALLRTLEQAIRDDEQRQALLLHVCHGLTVAEVAAVQGVSESKLERRLTMARKHLQGDTAEKDEKDESKLGAFLGFGSLAALGEALRPKKPIPDELGRELWTQIEQQIQQQGTDGDKDDEPAPPSSLPPGVVAALAPAGQTTTGLGFTKGTFGILLAGAFVIGNLSGAGGTSAWQACGAESDSRDTNSLPPACVAILPDTAATSSAASSSSAAVVTRASTSSSLTARSPGSVAVAASTLPSSRAIADSNRLVLQMRRAAAGEDFARVVTLAAEHTRRFGALQAAEREAERIQALRRLGRTAEAQQYARTAAATYPEHRGVIIRAAGHESP